MKRLKKHTKTLMVIDGYWKRMAELWKSGGMKLEELPEAQIPFAHFEPLQVYG